MCERDVWVVCVCVCVRARILIMKVVVMVMAVEVHEGAIDSHHDVVCVCVCFGYLWRLSVPGVHKFGCMVSP